MKLHVAVRGSVLPPEGDFCLRGARLPNKTDLLSDFAPFDHFELPGEKLKRAIDRPRRASRGFFNRDWSLGRSLEAKSWRIW